MAQSTRDKTLTSALRVGGLWQTQQPSSPSRFLERCLISFKMSTGQSSSPSSRFFRIVCSPAQYVTDSSFVEQGVNQRGREATEASTSADLWRDVWRDIDALGVLGDSLSVRKVKAHTAPEAVCAGVLTADDRAGNVMTWLMRLASWWFWSTVPREACERRGSRPTNLAVTRVAHGIARIGSARQRRDIDDGWIRASVCWTTRAFATLAPALATIRRRWHTYVDSAGRVCTLCQHPARLTRGSCPGEAGARARRSATNRA